MAPPIPALDLTPATGLRCRGTVGPSPQDCGHGGVPEGGTEIHNDYVLIVLKKIKKRVGRQHTKKNKEKKKTWISGNEYIYIDVPKIDSVQSLFSTIRLSVFDSLTN